MAGCVLEPVDFSRLRDVTAQAQITVLVGPGAGRGEKALTSAADTLAGTTLVKIDDGADVEQAVLLALRTGPAVLAIAGKSAFVSEILGGLLALKEADINVPPVLMLSPKKDAAAPLALSTAGKPMPILQAVSALIRSGEMKNHLLNVPLLQLSVVGGVTRLGLIFGAGAYAAGLKDNFQGLFDKMDLFRLHALPARASSSSPDSTGADLAKIAPETGGTITTYLYGALFSALPLPLLSTVRLKPDRPLVFLATERGRKARTAALRSFGGKLDRAEPYYGVHLIRSAAVSVRMPGPFSLDGAAIELPPTFTIKPTAPLEMLDLNDI